MNFKEYKAKSQAGKEAKIESSSFIYRIERSLSAVFSYVLVKIFPGVLPNHVSLANIILVLIAFSLAFVANAANHAAIVVIQIILLGLTSIVDKVDGEVARYKQYFTQRGIYFDLVYHFLYPFALYNALGYYFMATTGKAQILILSFLVSALAALYRTLGKVRHHIKFKIELESHRNVIRDLYPETIRVTPSRSPARFIDYLVFMTYDWVWLLYLILAILVFAEPAISYNIFLVHATLSLVVILSHILFIYPRRSLFSRTEFTDRS